MNSEIYDDSWKSSLVSNLDTMNSTMKRYKVNLEPRRKYGVLVSGVGFVEIFWNSNFDSNFLELFNKKFNLGT